MLTEQTTKSFVGKSTVPQSNLEFGGVNGFYANLVEGEGASRFENWASNAAYTTSQVIPIPLRTPAAFDLFDTSTAQRLKRIWIQLLSLHPYTIEGIQATISMETDSRRFGNRSQNQHEYVGTKMENGDITFTFIEKLGKPIKTFLDFYINELHGHWKNDIMGISMDPVIREKLKGRLGDPLLNTGDILFIELDNLSVNVIDAYYYTNFRLINSGKTEAKRDMGSNKEILEYSITAQGILDVGPQYNALAQQIIDHMTIFEKHPDNRIADIIDSNAQSVLTELGANTFNRENVTSGIPNASSATPNSVYK